MKLIQWSASYEIGNSQIDAEHMQLVETLNQLYTAMKENRGDQVVAKCLSGLSAYTRFHFDSEEKLFAASNYPETAQHKNEHQEFVKKIENWKKEFEAGKLLLTVDILDYLLQWTLNHIKMTDAKMVPWLQG